MKAIDFSDLKKLNRKELLELLLEQVKENERLKTELMEAKKELENREIIIENAGSLAEASLEIFEVFKNADKAAQAYLENVKNSLGNDGEDID
ncbi:hypothetical protein [Peptoniphilus sp.]|jgi:hypothetical protein|uniref:hypothetical protein n=1 Tax=Peptoniphilus sp. TaxID=1971214 RepID=UPI003D90378C